MARKASKKDTEAATAMAAAMASQMPEAMAKLGRGEFSPGDPVVSGVLADDNAKTEVEEVLFEDGAGDATALAAALEADDLGPEVLEPVILHGEPLAPPDAVQYPGEEFGYGIPGFQYEREEQNEEAKRKYGPEWAQDLPDEWRQMGLFPPASVKGELRYISLTRLPANDQLGPKAPDKGMLDSVRDMGVLTPIVVVMRPPWAISDLGETTAPVSGLLSGTYESQFRVGDGIRRIKALRLVNEEFGERQAKGKEWPHVAPSGTIPAMVYDADMLDPAVAAIIGNEQRSDNAPAILRAVERLLTEGHDPETVRGVTGWPKPTWARRTALLRLPRALLEGYYHGKIADGIAAQVVKLPRARQDVLAELYVTTGRLTGDDVRKAKSVASSAVQRSLATSLFSRASTPPLDAAMPEPEVIIEADDNDEEALQDEIREMHYDHLAPSRFGGGWYNTVGALLAQALALVPEKYIVLRNQIAGAQGAVNGIEDRLAIEAGQVKLERAEGKEAALPPDPQGVPIEELPE